MGGRKRTLILALLALAVPLPALALSEQSVDAEAERRLAAISVSASLDTCGVLEADIVCKVNVSFSPVAGATSYSASVTAADGSVTDHGSIGAEAATLFVPYAGDGGYSVRIIAYGPPAEPADADDQGEVIATGVSRPPSGEPEPRVALRRETERENEAEAAGRDAAAAVLEGSDGALQTETAPQPTEPSRRPSPSASSRRPAPGSEQPRCPSRRQRISIPRTRTRTPTVFSTPTRSWRMTRRLRRRAARSAAVAAAATAARL